MLPPTTPAPIVSYWPGGPLDYLRHAGLTSCVQAGHAVTLWSHSAVPNLPAGVSNRDAGTLLDLTSVARENHSLVADRMRWLTLAAIPGAIFVSPGVLVQSQLMLGQGGYLFGWQDARYLCADPVALPAQSEELAALLALGDDPAPVPDWLDDDLRAHLLAEAQAGTPVPAGHLPWGLLGAIGLTHALRQSGRIEQAVGVQVLSPITYADRGQLLMRKRKLADLTGPETRTVQMWPGESLREISATSAGLPRYWCPLGEALRRTETSPRDHLPRGLRLDPEDDRWQAKEPSSTPAPPVHDWSAAPPVAPAPSTPSVTPAPAPTGPPPRICALSCMKNEGPFILEWIAHHRAVGVTDFVIYTNDCTDGTDALLDLLVGKGIVTARFDNPWRPDTPGMSNPQFTAFDDAQSRPQVMAADWLIPLDVDEFMDIRTGDGTLAALFAALPGVDTISLPWRLFGNDGQDLYEDKLVTERFHSAAIERCNKPYQALGFKTLYRNDGRWQTISVHRPKNPDPAREAEISWASGNGSQMMPDYRDRGWRMQKGWAGYDLVSLNHYAVRDAESYLIKRDRGRVNHVSEDQGLNYWFRMNHNVVQERTIAPRIVATHAERDRLMADADIAAAHNACVTAHRAKIATLHQREDMAALYAAISGPVMQGLSRITPHFGNRIFEAGPQSLPDQVLDWARNGQTAPLPQSLDDPLPLDPMQADANRLLPAGSGLHFAASVEQTAEVSPPPPAAAPRIKAVAPQPAGNSELPHIPVSEDGQGVVRFRHLLRIGAEDRPRTPNGDQILIGAEAEAAYSYLQNRREKKVERLSTLPAPLPRQRVTLVTAMRNEAPFILEWIAWHQAIGVTDFLVYTNDCTDNTNAVLDRLDAMGILTRLDNPFNREAGQKPQRGALNDAAQHPLVTQADWVIVTDVDEFMNIHVGDGTIDALCAACGEPNLIAMTWKFFGNGGIQSYEDRPITEQFTACAPLFIPKPRLGWGFKTMVHRTAPFAKLGVHRPLALDEDHVDEIRWVNGSGQAMPEALTTGNGWRSTKRTIGYDLVTLNHYILRSAESFLVKRERGRINHVDQDQGQYYWSRRNYSTETDTRAVQFMATRVAPVLAALKSDPELARLHEEAVVWHRDRIAYLKSQPDYVVLYDSITDPDMPDAIYVAEVEAEDENDKD